MTTQFDRQLYGFRFADTMRGDSLQRIASRELGDAGRWVELVELNKLLPPFITDEASEAVAGVLLTGRQILIPAPVAVVTSTVDAEEVFEVDIKLDKYGRLNGDGADFVLVSGRENLRQALQNRVATDLNELMYHPEYGCDARRLVGRVNGPTAGLLGARAVRAAVVRDRRVDRVVSAIANVDGDAIRIDAEVEAVAGRTVRVDASL